MDNDKIIEQLEQVEALREAYETMLDVEDANSCKTISAFRRWYMSAVELFEELLGEDDQLLQRFLSKDVSGNGYTLRDMYPTLLIIYTKLKVKARRSSEQSGIKSTTGQEINMRAKKIFISHSHEDGAFATALVNLLHDIGFEYEEIFCSSVPACSIPEGQSIFDEIRAQFEKHDLFVIFIHSPRFYASHMSMNEMGAAWVLRADYCSFLTKDMTTDLMKKAVVRDDRVYVKIGDEQAKYRLNEWQERILKFFGKPAVKMNAWMQDSAKFLESVENLTYPEVLPNVPMSNDEILSEEDKKILKQWVDSNNIEMYKAEYIGGGCIILGDTDYPYTTAREEAKWNAFFKRLLKLGMIESTGREGNSARYLLTEKAYEYFEK